MPQRSGSAATTSPSSRVNASGHWTVTVMGALKHLAAHGADDGMKGAGRRGYPCRVIGRVGGLSDLLSIDEEGDASDGVAVHGLCVHAEGDLVRAREECAILRARPRDRGGQGSSGTGSRTKRSPWASLPSAKKSCQGMPK